MQIYSYSAGIDESVDRGFLNFGDDLNLWLWDRLFPDLRDRQEDTLFSAIGSHMNRGFFERFADRRHVVFGSGFGYGEPVESLPSQCDVVFVRGPHTAESLGISRDLAVADAATMIRFCIRPNPDRDIRAAVMPHVASMALDGEAWRIAADSAGIKLIDVRRPLLEILALMSRCEVILTEALHGAIVADALRVDWIPLVSNPTISSRKWADWCACIGSEYAPERLPTLWGHATDAGLVAQTRRSLKIKLLIRRLKKLLGKRRRYLSDERHAISVDERLAERTISFCQTYEIANTLDVQPVLAESLTLAEPIAAMPATSRFVQS